MEITLVTENSKIRYVGDGSKVEFNYEFNPIDISYVKVYKNLIEVKSPDVTIEPGVVTFGVAPLAGESVVIVREMPLTYERGIVSKGVINSDSLDNLAVELLGQIQQVNEKISRVPMYPIDTPLTGEEIFNEFNQNVQAVKDAKEEVEGKVEEVNNAVSSGLANIEQVTSENKTEITTEKNNAISEIESTTAGLIQRAETAADEAEASRANAEEWAQSVNAENIVHRTGAEEIFDIKKFKGASPIHIDRNGNTQTEIMAENNGTRTGGFRNYDNGANTTSMYVVDENNVIVGNMFIAYDGSSVFASAPTPPAGSNSTNIATTNWVSDPAKSTNVVHRSSNEAIDGVKIFRKNVVSESGNGAFGFVARNNNITKGATPSVHQYVGYDIRAKNDERLVYLGVRYGSDGVKRLELQKQDANLTEFSAEQFITKVATPSVSSSGLETLNAQWFNKKIQVVGTLPSSPDANVFYFCTNA